MNRALDERHLAYFDLFPLDKGQVNISKVYPGSIVAWHLHKRQDDFWFVLNGLLKVGIEGEFSLLGEGESLHVPANTWHGFMGLRETDLIYYVTNKYDGTDEEREPIGKYGERWEVEAK